MSPHSTLRNKIGSPLEAHPRAITALFTVMILLAQMGTAAASGNCGIITGP